MDPAEFEMSLSNLHTDRLDRAWFVSLQQLYKQCTPSQRRDLQLRLGWEDESCKDPTPEEYFGANCGDRTRIWMTDEDVFRHHIADQITGADYRDDLTEMMVCYNLAILRGFDPDKLLESVAAMSTGSSAELIRGFLARTDKGPNGWTFGAYFDEKGHVQFESTGHIT
jgi:hypothetical protein